MLSEGWMLGCGKEMGIREEPMFSSNNGFQDMQSKILLVAPPKRGPEDDLEVSGGRGGRS